LVSAPLTNGRYFDCLIEVPAGVVDAGSLHASVHEIPPVGVPRLRRSDGGPLHEFWGHPRRAAALTQEEADEGPRLATVTVDLGELLGGAVFRARAHGWGDRRFVAEALVDSPTDDATRPLLRVYDALEDHPVLLRFLIAARGQARRQRTIDEPPAWAGGDE
jgi:hypothetical protein